MSGCLILIFRPAHRQILTRLFQDRRATDMAIEDIIEVNDKMQTDYR
jgi:hypothetical protein